MKEELKRNEEEEAMLKPRKEERQNHLQEEENEQKQNQELAQEIKELIVIQDMEVKQQQKNQNVDLMPSAEQIITQCSPPTNG